ncbi:MAG: dTDP-4-dehydrorhamnose reductase [Deltaproteobacteria bacterium]|nr:dTDP-4-dehydrorhamnose reductase [Deltaproteobacteria bacterium]
MPDFPMKVLVTGSRGMLASMLVPLLGRDRGLEVFLAKGLDITDLPAVKETLEGFSPGVVINCAAYNAVDRAEEERELAFSVNALGPANLARVCGKIGSRLVHFSTDFVFDGRKNSPYREEDGPNPLNVYGESKLEGELNVRKETGDYMIVRTSWLYGPGRDNFVTRIISKAGREETLSVVCDQTGTPTYTEDLSEAVMNLLMADAPSGTYHFSNEGVASRYDLAKVACELASSIGVPIKVKDILPVLTEQYPSAAKRPGYSVLDTAKYKKTTGKTIRQWTEALSRYIERDADFFRREISSRA